MSGIFPDAPDGGLAPNAMDPNNPIAAYPPITPPLNTSALYYGNGCDVRLRPEVLNSLISELEAVADQAKLAYDYTRRENVELAIRYLIQRGLQTGTIMSAGPFDYTAVLDPVSTGLNNYMTLIVIPAVNNQGTVRLNVDGHGLYPMVRNDGQALRSADLRGGIPSLISFWSGYWFHVGLLPSQVPLIATGGVDAWVRTDGNDFTGDGTANDPSKAFRTIQGAWNAVGGRYAASPLFSINIRLGIPGDYEMATLGPYGGQVTLTGDMNNKAAYRVLARDIGQVVYALRLSGMNMTLYGVNLVQPVAGTFLNGAHCLRISGSAVWVVNCQMTLEATANPSAVILMESEGSLSCMGDQMIEGNGQTVSAGMDIAFGSFGGCPPGSATSVWTWQNMNFNNCGHWVRNASVCSLGNMALPQSAVTGSIYDVQSNGLLYQQGLILPGNAPGTVGSQGQVFP